MADAFARLESIATEDGEPAKPAAKPVAAPVSKPPAPASTTPLKAGEKPSTTPAEKSEGAEAPTPADGEKPVVEPVGKGKASPWKLLDTFKGKLAERERELAELRSKSADPEMVTGLTKRAQTAEARNKELESDMKYVDYKKSSEFKEKYEQPFQKAWIRAVKDVTQLTVTDEAGTQRVATAEDLWSLVNLPLGEATRRAKELFGDDLGNYVMSNHYGKIRELSEAQTEALETARKEGTNREQQKAQDTQLIRGEVAQTYERVRDEQAQKQPWLQEREGDDDWNAKLAKSLNFVEETLKSSAFDSKLTAEQRAELVSRHVAVRNRAIAFPMLRLENKRQKAELDALRKQVAEFTGTEPGAGDGKPAADGTGTPGGGVTMESVLAGLDKFQE